jgi:hypothetical protein
MGRRRFEAEYDVTEESLLAQTLNLLGINK